MNSTLKEELKKLEEQERAAYQALDDWYDKKLHEKKTATGNLRHGLMMMIWKILKNSPITGSIFLSVMSASLAFVLGLILIFLFGLFGQYINQESLIVHYIVVAMVSIPAFASVSFALFGLLEAISKLSALFAGLGEKK